MARKKYGKEVIRYDTVARIKSSGRGIGFVLVLL